MEKNKQFILNKILNTEISEDPWKHLIIKDFLPDSLYNGVKDEISCYIESPALKKENVAAYHVFVNESMGVMPDTPNLLEYYNILLDGSIINAIKNKLSVCPGGMQTPHEDGVIKDFFSELNLLKDITMAKYIQTQALRQ